VNVKFWRLLLVLRHITYYYMSLAWSADV